MSLNSRILIGLTSIALVTGCSSSSDPKGATLTAGGAAITAVNTTLSKLAVPPGGAAAFNTYNEVKSDVSLLSNQSDWTTALLPDPRNSGGSCSYTSAITPATYMQIDFTEKAVRCNGSDVNVFGRVRHGLSIACAVGHIAPYATTADMPTTGSVTYTISSDLVALIKTDCNVDLSEKGVTSISVAFSVPTSTVDFERIITPTLVTSGGSQVQSGFYMTYNSSKVAVAENESNENGANRLIVILDRTQNILKGEYVSGPNTAPMVAAQHAVYIHRIYYDGANDIGRVFNYVAVGTGSTVNTVNSRYVVTGKPQSGSDYAVGLDFYGAGWGAYTGTGSSYNLSACVSTTNGTITSMPVVTANAFTCGASSGISPAAITADSAIWTNIHNNTTTWFNFTAVPSNAWTFSNIHTSNITL